MTFIYFLFSTFVFHPSSAMITNKLKAVISIGCVSFHIINDNKDISCLANYFNADLMYATKETNMGANTQVQKNFN